MSALAQLVTTEKHRAVSWTLVALGDIARSNRWNPAYYEERFVEVEHTLRRIGAQPLGRFIPETLEDGSKGITYGQVGERELNPRGAVRYLQVINIRDTGIDFAIKPDRIVEGSHNDPPRSRVRAGDILLTRTGFRETTSLLGRCVVVTEDYGKVNISEDIDRIRVVGVSPYYVCAFLKSKYGQLQIQRVVHGVDSQKINFGRIKELLFPDASDNNQQRIDELYHRMAGCHRKAMAVKESLLHHLGIEPGRYGEAINHAAQRDPVFRRSTEEAKLLLSHLISEVEGLVEGSRRNIKLYSKPLYHA